MEWEVINGDCVRVMHDQMADDSVDISVFSPPFASLFAYSGELEDMGNANESDGEFALLMSFFFRQLLRVTKPGRIACCHIMNVVFTERTFGRKGLRDLRGLMVRLAERAGFWFWAEAAIQKNPQATAVRTHSDRLLFVRFEDDHLGSAPDCADYVVFLKKPGDPEVSVTSPITRDEWISWAAPLWTDIRQTKTLNVRGSKSEGDTKHICPLQLDVIERCIRLYSNEGELVFSPFCGIGSEGVSAIKLGRRFKGVELKPEWAARSKRECESAVLRRQEQTRLFDGVCDMGDDDSEPGRGVA